MQTLHLTDLLLDERYTAVNIMIWMEEVIEKFDISPSIINAVVHDNWVQHFNPGQIVVELLLLDSSCLQFQFRKLWTLFFSFRCASDVQVEARRSYVWEMGEAVMGHGSNIPEEFTQAGRDVTRMGMASLQQPTSPATPPTMHKPHLPKKRNINANIWKVHRAVFSIKRCCANWQGFIKHHQVIGCRYTATWGRKHVHIQNTPTASEEKKINVRRIKF